MFKSIIAAAAAAICTAAPAASAQNSFSYQGQLSDAGVPANGTYDLRFRVWDDLTPGAPDNQIGSINTHFAVSVTDGLFTVNLDLDDAAFATHLSRYLQIDVRLNGAPTYTTLTPRQQITYSPRSFYAAESGVAELAQGIELPYIQSGLPSPASGPVFWIQNDTASGYAIRGDAPSIGILGVSDFPTETYPGTFIGTGVGGLSSTAGVMGTSDSGYGVVGWSWTGTGGHFQTVRDSATEYALHAVSTAGSTAGLFEVTDNFNVGLPALIAKTDSTENSVSAILGIIESTSPGSFTAGVKGENRGTGGFGIGVWGSHDGSGWGIYGESATGLAGRFEGNVHINGVLSKSSGSFKIDHPLNPETMYLSHSFVESPDMKNIYDGVITLDESGSATVTLPTYFNALNQDFRYQLTCIGSYAPVFIKSEINDRSFTIAGGTEGLKISWQVTGVRHDAWANQNRIVVEEQKSSDDQGKYLNPSVFDQPKENGIGYIPNPETQN